MRPSSDLSVFTLRDRFSLLSASSMGRQCAIVACMRQVPHCDRRGAGEQWNAGPLECLLHPAPRPPVPCGTDKRKREREIAKRKRERERGRMGGAPPAVLPFLWIKHKVFSVSASGHPSYVMCSVRWPWLFGMLMWMCFSARQSQAF